MGTGEGDRAIERHCTIQKVLYPSQDWLLFEWFLNGGLDKNQNFGKVHVGKAIFIGLKYLEKMNLVGTFNLSMDRVLKSKMINT